jgi:hypothetical protein
MPAACPGSSSAHNSPAWMPWTNACHAVLAEQDDEWTESRRYMRLEILAAYRKITEPVWDRISLVRLD